MANNIEDLYNLEDIEEMQELLDTIKEDRYPMYPDHFAAANLRPGWERYQDEFIGLAEKREDFAGETGMNIAKPQGRPDMSVNQTLGYKYNDSLLHPDFDSTVEQRYQTLKEKYNFFDEKPPE